MPDPAESGRSRMWRALREPSRSQVVVGILMALVGFAAVTQIQVTQDASSYSGFREQDLIDAFSGLSGTTQRTRAEIERLSAARSELQSETTQRRAALDQAQQEVDSLNVLAGVVPVSGPGIRVTITEVTGTVQVGSILDTLQELRSVGAEALQINGQVRVVAQTSFEDGVGGLLVDGTLVESPYVLDAIGVPNTLASAIRFALGPRKQLETDGATVDVVELASLDIDAVRRLVQPEFATPDP
ncbi:MAG: DUF881 domain-containing protein [Nocardioides sp.]